MTGRRVLMLFVTITVSTVIGFAQMTSRTPLLDSRGKPLPFGVPAYHKPDVPLGTGLLRRTARVPVNSVSDNRQLLRTELCRIRRVETRSVPEHFSCVRRCSWHYHTPHP